MLKRTGASIAVSFVLALGAMAGCVSSEDDAGMEPPESAQSLSESEDDNEIPFKKSTFIIELTEDDIEIQAFVDGNEWKRLKIFDPREKKIFDVKAKRRLGKQAMSEMEIASEPSHYLEDEPDFDESIESFLARFPEGEYEFEGVNLAGQELEGVANFTHVMPAIPEIVEPSSDTEEPATLPVDEAAIEWEQVRETYYGSDDIEIVEYEVIVEQVEPFRKLSIHLPRCATSLTVPREFLAPGSFYDVEVVAIEAGGNKTIAVTEFVTEP